MFIIEVTNQHNAKAFVFNQNDFLKRDQLLIAAPLTPDVKIFFDFHSAFRYAMKYDITILAKSYKIVQATEMLDSPDFVANNQQIKALNESIYFVLRKDRFDNSIKYLSWDAEQQSWCGNPNRKAATIFLKKYATKALQTLRHSDLGAVFLLEEIGLKK